MYRDEDKLFIGRTVTGLDINPDKTVLEMGTDKGSLYIFATGDCCSHSWFENISGVRNLVGHKILSVEETSLPEKTVDNDDYDVLKFYSFKIKTDKGIFEIEYRNSSNGYYGGEIEVYEDPGEHYNCDYVENMKELTKDF